MIAPRTRPRPQETTGTRHTRLRIAAGWTQGELAQRSLVHVQTISRAERDHAVRAWVLADLARALDVCPGVLLEGRCLS